MNVTDGNDSDGRVEPGQPGSGAQPSVLIIGAGPTGLTLANVLARAAVPFRIIDTKPGPVTESRALLVQPRTVEYWDKLGLAEDALHEGQTATRFNMLVAGTPVGRLTFGGPQETRTPYPFALVLEQSQTERLLVEQLNQAGGRVTWETALEQLDVSDTGATATVRHRDGTHETITAAWVVGADGVRSSVRRQLNLGFHGITHEQGFFLADVDLDWPLRYGELYANLTADGFFAFFPMRGERHYRLLGNLTPELWAKHDRGERVQLHEIQAILDQKSGLTVTLTDARWISTYRVHTRIADHFRVGRVFLAGDAAHTHSPAASQGMNTGIGDAYNLGWKLAAVINGHAQPTLLDSYAAERMPVARAIMGLTDRIFALEVTKNPLLNWFRLGPMPRLLGITTRLRAFNRLAFGLVSQIRTSYRGSPAVAETSPVRSGPHAGDRAPYGTFTDGTSLYAVLRGVDHHLLLFEGRSPDPARLEAAREELELLFARYAASVQTHTITARNRALHQRYGAQAASLFLVRPDGHIAYRGAAGDLVGLRLYLDRWFTKRAIPAHLRTAPDGRVRRDDAGVTQVERV